MSQMGVYGVGARRAARSKSASEAGTPASLADIEGRPGYRRGCSERGGHGGPSRPPGTPSNIEERHGYAGALPSVGGHWGPFEAPHLQFSRGGVASADHHQRERVEADADPVLDQEEDGAIERVQRHAGDERPAASLDRLIADEREE